MAHVGPDHHAADTEDQAEKHSLKFKKSKENSGKESCFVV